MRRGAVALAAFLLATVVPAAGATPLACADPCIIQASNAGYRLPITEVRSGTWVKWESVDTAHPTSDSTDPNTRCFLESAGSPLGTNFVRFDIVDGVVHATTAPETASERTARCAGAVALPDGSFALAYRCMIHAYLAGGIRVES